MKQAVLAGLVLAAAGAVAVVVVLNPSPAKNGSFAAGRAGQAATAGALPVSDWPTYRGGAGMMGVASGELPDAMRVRWRFKTGQAISSSAVIAAGRVYFGSDDSNVYCLSAVAGKEVWRFAAGDQVQAPPIYLDGRIYVGAGNSFFYCLDAATGQKLWQFEAQDRIVGSANALVDANSGAAARVVVGSHDYHVYCLDAATGSQAWKYAANNYINGGLAVAGGLIVFGSCDSSLHAITAGGKDAGNVATSAYVAVTPAFDGSKAYAGNYDGELACIDVAARKIVWKSKVDSPFNSSPAVGADRILAGCQDGKLYCFDRAGGKKLWTFAARDEINSSPVICGQRAVVGSNDGRLYVVSLADGKLVWSYDLGQPVTSSAAAGAGLVIVGCDDGYLYAFEARR